MKTILSPKYLLMLAALSLISFSCKKETLVPAAVNDPSALASPMASIVDLGPTDSIPHIMMATLANQYIVLSNGISENNASDAVVTFSFNSSADGIIPSGTYTYSASTSQPFTFSGGMLKSASISGNNNEVDVPVTGGTIYVTQKSAGYDISFVCNLSTGDQLNGVYTGSAQYTDNQAASSKK